jgi:triacylglycerol esterase/lipase EstA (alpha/beta hydrolase family)
MLARFQRITTLLLLFFALLWLVWAWAKGHPYWAIGGATALLMGHAAFLALEFVWMHWQNRHDPAPRATVQQALLAWCREVLTAPQVFCWQQPFRSERFANTPLVNAQGQMAVLLVHGFVCNRGLWNPWLQRLHERGTPFCAVNLEPPWSSIDDYANTIDIAVGRLHAATGQAVLVVAHSMGGLAVRAWLRRSNADHLVQHVITIGSPHHGTRLARFAVTANGLQMQQSSEWLHALAANESNARRSLFTCFFSHCDNVVFPASTASLAGANNVHLPACAHSEMARHETVFQELLRRLDAAKASNRK